MVAITFGPVPSRRLGRSLGINNIPPKVCSYSCVYCQVGRTLELAADRRGFYASDDVVRQVETKVREVRDRGEAIDYLTFVPDGEPTLDVHLGKEIAGLRPLGIPLAVISNASLIDREDVRADLLRADCVSLKVDAVRDDTWRRVNRPHGRLRLDDLGRYLEALGPDVAYLSVPTRPPAEEWVRPPEDDVVLRAWRSLEARLPDTRVELLIGDEGNAFAATGEARADLLAITAVHPMREAAVADLLARTGAARREHKGRTFFMRRFARQKSAAAPGAAPVGTS